MDHVDLRKLLDETIPNYTYLLLDATKNMPSNPSEADLRDRVQSLLLDFCSKVGMIDVTNISTSEVKLSSGGRADAVFNNIVIEYKKPNKLKNKSEIEKSEKQIENYLKDLGKHSKRTAGVVFDGKRIIFAYYENEKFVVENPVNVSRESLERLLRWISELASKRVLNARNLKEDFDLENEGNREKVLKPIYDGLQKSIQKPIVGNLYEQWHTFFSQSIDYSGAYNENVFKKLNNLVKSIGIKASTKEEANKLFFVLHTYFALLVKLIAWLALSKQLRDEHNSPSFGKLSSINSDELVKNLKNMESGGVFRDLGINNLLEGDFFQWYVYAWNDSIESAIRYLLARLEYYDSSSLSILPEKNRDLFKMLYHYLLPREIRHNLGEYYTPDWLAERLLQNIDEEFFTGNIEQKKDILLKKLENLRWLDPACGSGTFLVIIISRMIEIGKALNVDKGKLLKYITNNVVGFDINPLAVIVARVNYLLAILSLLEDEKDKTLNITIPVYLADSVRTPYKGQDLISMDTYKFPTAIGEFEIPISLCTRERFDKFCELLEKHVNNMLEPHAFIAQIEKEPLLNEVLNKKRDKELAKKVYRQLLELKNRGMNGLWVRLLKNNFAPLVVGQFDYIVGNPPWINWDNLPNGYRESIKPLWEHYGLFPHRGMATTQGKSKKDFSMLITYVVCDKLLKQDGKLGFLITQSVFKTSASEGFRKFSLPNNIHLKVLLVEDMTFLKPFEGASNRTALIVLQKGQPTTYPIEKYIFWKKKKEVSFNYSSTLKEVLESTERIELIAEPVLYPNNITSHWLTIPAQLLRVVRKVIGKSDYEAHLGANTGGANSVYWVNDPRSLNIEQDLLYPLLKGRDVKKWKAEPSAWIIMVQDPNARKGIEENELQMNYPRTYGYLKQSEDKLKNRKMLKKYYTRKDKNGKVYETAPFYSMFDVGPYTFDEWKVVWTRMGSKLNAAVVNLAQNKPVIPQETITLVACKSKEEAHYVCAVINSRIVNFIVKSYSQEGGKSFGSTHILHHISIPTFNAQNPIHTKLACLSMKAHKFKELEDLKSLNCIEQKIDQLCAKLWGISDDELELILEEMRKLYPEEQEFKI